MASIYIHGRQWGTIEADGSVYHNLSYLGKLEATGETLYANGSLRKYLGSIKKDGYVYSTGLDHIATIKPDGYIYTPLFEQIGHIDGFWDVYYNLTKKRGGSGIPLPDDGTSCLVALLLGGGVLYALFYILVYAVAIGIILAMVAGLIAVVGVIVYFIINAVRHGEFAKNPNAKAISGIIASVIIGIGLFIAYQGGYLEYFVGSPNNNTASSSQNVQYEDDESDYDEYDDGDVSGNDYEEKDDSYSGSDYAEEDNNDYVEEDNSDSDSGNNYVEKDNSDSDLSNYYSDDDYDSEEETHSTVSADAAEFGPVQIGDHTYAIFNYKDLGLNTWEECEEYCEEHGGYMAVINDENENNSLYNYLRSCGLKVAMFGYTNDYYYTDGSWTWVHGYSDYTNWASGQPNDGASTKSGDPEPYAEFYKNSSEGKWNDASFGANTWRFICEWD